MQRINRTDSRTYRGIACTCSCDVIPSVSQNSVHTKYKNVTEAHRENRWGRQRAQRVGPTGFRGGPQCSREKGSPSGAKFGILARFYGVFHSFFAIFGVFCIISMF